jgi:hypothetical protein
MTLVAGRYGEADNPLSLYNSLQWGIIITVWPDRASPPNPIAELWVAIHSAKVESLTIPGSEIPKGRLAQPRRLFEHRIEHRCEIPGRRIDDLPDLGGRGLLLQGFITLGGAFS